MAPAPRQHAQVLEFVLDRPLPTLTSGQCYCPVIAEVLCGVSCLFRLQMGLLLRVCGSWRTKKMGGMAVSPSQYRWARGERALLVSPYSPCAGQRPRVREGETETQRRPAPCQGHPAGEGQPGVCAQTTGERGARSLTALPLQQLHCFQF